MVHYNFEQKITKTMIILYNSPHVLSFTLGWEVCNITCVNAYATPVATNNGKSTAIQNRDDTTLHRPCATHKSANFLEIHCDETELSESMHKRLHHPSQVSE